MATLAGRAIRTLLTQLEIVSDEKNDVLHVERNQSTGNVTLSLRKAWKDKWDPDATFTISAEDVSHVTMAMGGSDVAWRIDTIQRIPNTVFTADAPDHVEQAVEKALAENNGRCSELDLERAKAATLAEQRATIEAEFRLDHSRDRHIRGRVDGCPECEKGWSTHTADVANGERLMDDYEPAA